MANDKNIVHVTTQMAALSEPNFVIEHEGRLYLTLALIEYDPKAAGLSPEQKPGIKQMQQLFGDARHRGELKAVPVSLQFEGPGPVATGPVATRPPAPGPDDSDRTTKR